MRSRSGPASWMTGPVRAPATDVTDLPRGTSRGRPPCAWRAPPAPRSTLVSGSGSGAKAATAARPDHRHRLGRRPKRPPSTSPTCSPPTAAAPCSATWAPWPRPSLPTALHHQAVADRRIEVARHSRHLHARQGRSSSGSLTSSLFGLRFQFHCKTSLTPSSRPGYSPRIPAHSGQSS